MPDKSIFPALEAQFRAMADELGPLSTPLHAYIAGGMAVNFYTGHRMSNDVDIAWSHRVVFRPELQTFTVPDPENRDERLLVTLDSGFSDTLGTFHPDWKEDAPEVARVGDVIVHMITPLDLAVSKIGRFADRDREDIMALARAGLVSSGDLGVRANEALEYFVGNTTFAELNIRDAVDGIRRIEEEGVPRHE